MSRVTQPAPDISGAPSFSSYIPFNAIAARHLVGRAARATTAAIRNTIVFALLKFTFLYCIWAPCLSNFCSGKIALGTAADLGETLPTHTHASDTATTRVSPLTRVIRMFRKRSPSPPHGVPIDISTTETSTKNMTRIINGAQTMFKFIHSICSLLSKLITDTRSLRRTRILCTLACAVLLLPQAVPIVQLSVTAAQHTHVFIQSSSLSYWDSYPPGPACDGHPACAQTPFRIGPGHASLNRTATHAAPSAPANNTRCVNRPSTSSIQFYTDCQLSLHNWIHTYQRDTLSCQHHARGIAPQVLPETTHHDPVHACHPCLLPMHISAHAYLQNNIA